MSITLWIAAWALVGLLVAWVFTGDVVNVANEAIKDYPEKEYDRNTLTNAVILTFILLWPIIILGSLISCVHDYFTGDKDDPESPEVTLDERLNVKGYDGYIVMTVSSSRFKMTNEDSRTLVVSIFENYSDDEKLKLIRSLNESVMEDLKSK
jgi:hypothetical protein